MSFSASARWYSSALRYSSETRSPPIARSDRTSSRMRCRNSRELRSWSRSSVRTGSAPDRSAYSFSCARDAATKSGTYQVVTEKSRGFFLGRGPGAQAARGEEGVEDELGGAGQGAEVAEGGRQQGGRPGPAEPHQGGQVADLDGVRRGLVHLGREPGQRDGLRILGVDQRADAAAEGLGRAGQGLAAAGVGGGGRDDLLGADHPVPLLGLADRAEQPAGTGVELPAAHRTAAARLAAAGQRHVPELTGRAVRAV